MTIVSLLDDGDDDVDGDEREDRDREGELMMLVGCEVMYDVVIRMFVSD